MVACVIAMSDEVLDLAIGSWILFGWLFDSFYLSFCVFVASHDEEAESCDGAEAYDAGESLETFSLDSEAVGEGM